jgi:hypothetical protein
MFNLKTLCLLFIFSCIFASCSAAQEKIQMESPDKLKESSAKVNPETKRFESKEGNFSINISQVPSQFRNVEPEKGRDPGKQFFWQFERTVYTVMYSAFDKNDLSRAFDDMNTGVRKSMARQGIKLITDKEISFGKYPAREFTYVLPNGVKYVQRNYLVNDVGYLLTAGYVDEKSEKEAFEVIDSFKLLTEK